MLRRAARTFERLAYRNVFLRFGDGGDGWPDAAPFDAILVAAIPPGLAIACRLGLRFAKLAEGAQTVAPLSQSQPASKAWPLCLVAKPPAADAPIVEPQVLC